MADTTPAAVEPAAALEAREAAVCPLISFSPPSLHINLNTYNLQVTAREQAVEKKEAELAAREAALAAKETPAPAPAAESAEPEAAVCPFRPSSLLSSSKHEIQS